MKSNKRVPGLISLKQIIENTSAFTGKEFFESLVKNLAEILDVHGVWVTEFWPAENKLNSLAFWLEGKYVDKYTYTIENTPCAPVLDNPDIFHVPDNIIELYPGDNDLKSLGGVSYMGISLRDIDGTVLGHLALLHNKPMPEIPEVFAIFKIFASRAAAELRREIAQRKINESESKLNRLVNGTSDAIIEFNSDFEITQNNEAALRLFEIEEDDFTGNSLMKIFDAKSYHRLMSIIPQHGALSNKYDSLHLNDPVICLTNSGMSFPAEVNLSCYTFEQKLYYVLYIKNIEDKILDKVEIKKLNVERIMLREKINAHQFDYIIGDSKPIQDCIELVNQVAPTDANVLILGETGTGKELFAKAVHDASLRKDRPMITLNCAALPSDLIESELFGHVRGAFTGATTDREGRFSLANKGTIFLDEVAELPLPLQAKLLRVIQEGSFEPVGSSVTKFVDVRIIAATHRDLRQRIEDGKFREDLYFRLNVYPISIPPLRERESDLELLANAFMSKFAVNLTEEIEPLSRIEMNKLYAYHWPGNVRELQNIIERGIIISRDGNFRVDNIIPFIQREQEEESQSHKILTDQDIRLLEKNNIIKALNQTNWKISGKGGAAELLNLPRTTLTSKIAKLGIKRIAVG
jgi:PAS domain S-box-containing protein